ncbi:hypothetical protein C9I98_10695 [Photobacterium sanctipauli]|uniref:YtxH domain-containing protein n=2 Tax=Photobacterium sanctipauli TaxID=1342794 RepID=A0A2T3NUJ8_9GAMM|nr:hypothetical protein [Photobacterium sanctipauli]PSW19918.1 hypothetical protein C9I98_10695 [Photobacterium sanctipauli]
MLKYIIIALVGFGIYIGVTYKDQIEDLTNSRSLEDVQDVYEDISDKASDTVGELSDKLEELK